MNTCLHVFLPVISFLASAICQIIVCRYAGLLKSIFIGFALGAFVLLSRALGYLNEPGYLIGGVIIYSALWNTYFHFLNMGETARRVRILRELMASEGGLSLSEIFSRYNSEEIIERRLRRLIDSGQIALRDNRYYIASPFMLLITMLAGFLKGIVLGNRKAAA